MNDFQAHKNKRVLEQLNAAISRGDELLKLLAPLPQKPTLTLCEREQ